MPISEQLKYWNQELELKNRSRQVIILIQSTKRRSFRVLWVLLTCILALTSQQLIAQTETGTLSGFVFDAETKEPLPYANIIIEGTTRGTYSKNDGSYSIKLPPGETKIRYRFLSYKDTVVTVQITAGLETEQTVYLKPDLMSMDVTVSANRVAREMQNLARMRDQKNSNLRSYSADLYKLAILSNVGRNFSYEKLDSIDLEPIAFSERKSKLKYIADPERYSETLVANRASENFFSEYDFFSTGGEPLNLNDNEISLSILSENITVVGPISARAGDFYELYDEDADSSWPAGTIEVSFYPIHDNRPLFEGKAWYNPDNNTILGVDVMLNDYAETNTGTFSISDLRYQQSYQKVGDFWLPERTELSAVLKFITSKDKILYKDEWTWINLKVNRQSEPQNVKLNTVNILLDAHQKEAAYWDTLSGKQENRNTRLLSEVQNYEEDRVAVKVGMSVFRSFFRLPYQLERFYLTNISHIYSYNRVQGHYLGLGLRTPVSDNYEYRAIAGYGFGNENWSYQLSGYHFPGGIFIGPEVSYFKRTFQQYQDYEYNRTPLDFFELRQTINGLTTGTTGNNFFEREGVNAGLRFRLDTESFIRMLYMAEDHHSLNATTDFRLFGSDLEPQEFRNNDPLFPAEEGSLRGIYMHLHHDTRQYLRTQFLRDYNIREFGWLVDAVLEKGVNSMGSDFDYNRYRVGLKFYWPVFSTHFFQTDIIVAASDEGTPNQRLFTYNGYVVDDYVRYRPFATVDYRQPLGHRVSQIKIRYKFGSSLTRSIPIGFIQKSGIQISTILTAGVLDQEDSLQPLYPHSNAEAQAEIGIAASKIFGIFYAEFSKKLYGKFGNSYGITLLF